MESIWISPTRPNTRRRCRRSIRPAGLGSAKPCAASAIRRARAIERESTEVAAYRPCRCGPASTLTRIMVMSETLPLAEIKARLSEIVDKVEGQHERVTLTRNGRPAAVLISPEDLEALEDTLELLADPKAVREIEQARREIAEGKGLKVDELR